VVSGVGDECDPSSDGENEHIATEDETLQFG
jgi:hypothetical protein